MTINAEILSSIERYPTELQRLSIKLLEMTEYEKFSANDIKEKIYTEIREIVIAEKDKENRS
jgi:hypothetical protein